MISEFDASVPICATRWCRRPIHISAEEPRSKTRWCLECQLTGQTSERLAALPADAPQLAPHHDVYVVEFNCLQCGRHITDVTVDNERDAVSRLAPGLRCRVCHGQPVRSGEVTRRTVTDAEPTRLPEARVEEAAS